MRLPLVLSSAFCTALASTPANPELTGVDYRWVFPSHGIMLSHHYAHGHPNGYLPPNVSAWTDASHPLRSKFLTSTMHALQLGNYRYPGGGQCDWWLWRNETFGPAASPSQLAVSQAAQQAFPPHALGISEFAEVVRAAGSKFLLTLDVSRSGPASDTGIPALVAKRLGQPGSGRGLRFEMGSEEYGAAKGFPQPGGFFGSPDYISAVTDLIAAVHKLPGARVGVGVHPCPFVYPAGTMGGHGSGKCYDNHTNAIGRFHEWNANLSRICTERSAQGAGRCDAVIVHIYKCNPAMLSLMGDDQLLTTFLAVPEVMVDNAVASLRRDYPDGTKLWISEYNTFWEAASHGAADVPSRTCSKCRPAIGAFFNATVNSAAHAVHVAGYLLAAIANGDVVEVMNYHSFFEGPEFHSVGPTHKPGEAIEGVPGYYSAVVNESGTYIGPVAQMFGLFSRWLRADGATMEGIQLPPGAPTVPFNLSVTSLFDGPAFCAQAAAICGSSNRSAGAGGSRVIAINRCLHPLSVSVPVGDACGGGRTGWQSTESFNASTEYSVWARLSEATPHDGPMWPARGPGGKGSDVALAPHSLTVVLL
jgi:hypothetical protein